MNKLFILFFSIGLLTQACLQNTKKTASDDPHRHHLEETAEIELNQNKKWPVDPPMMAIIRDMNQSVLDFKGKSVGDYKQLGDSLSKKINMLTSSCTMQGKAHDELHKWLVPFIDLVGEFSEIKSIEDGKKYFSTVEKEFNRFDVYFE